MFITKKSFAKINLYLEITGINSENNYHLVSSLISFIDLYDLLTVEKNKEFSLIIENQNSDHLNRDIKNNLITKVINLLKKKYCIKDNFKITLKKNIPVAAGLGGASSNAATIIKIIDKIYNLKITKSDYFEFANQLGADVHFFLQKNICFVYGYGEKLKKINPSNFPESHILIVNPNKLLSTKKIFTLFKEKNNLSKKKIISTEYPNSNLIKYCLKKKNLLQDIACGIIPEISEIISFLQKKTQAKLVRMSGSGPTCFALYKNENDLDEGYRAIKNKFSTFYLRKSRIITDLSDSMVNLLIE